MNFNLQNILRRTNRKLWIYLICVLLPLALLPLAFSPSKESKCAYVLSLVSCYWLLEPVHMAVTAFLPIILFPVLGVISSREVCNNYMSETIIMFIGGLIVAVAVEDSKLHERIALKVLLLIGTELKWLMMGFMLSTMFLSMWINNMATTAMMVPIAEAIIEKIGKTDKDIEMKNADDCYSISEEKTKDKVENGSITKENVNQPHSNALSSTKIALLLSICYSANIGGTGSLTGCAANMVLKGFVEDLYPESNEITFASWLMYSVPGMLLCVFIAWLYLWAVYIRRNKRILQMQSGKNIMEIISKRYDDLQSMTAHEIQVLFLFLILVFLWIFRDPKFIHGWADSIGSDTKIGDSFPAILIAFLLFFLPADPRRVGGRPILKWKTAQNNVPWGVIILVGGGFALADAAKKSGLSKTIGAQLSSLSVLPPVVIVAVICFMTAMITEIMSNTATATILLPVINEMAISIGENPLRLMIPVIISCSYAFMLPVATVPNAIAFECGNMRTVDMAKPGLVMNLVCCLVQLLMIHTLGVALFDLNSFPSWLNKIDNVTSSVTEEITFIANSTMNSSLKTSIP